MDKNNKIIKLKIKSGKKGPVIKKKGIKIIDIPIIDFNYCIPRFRRSLIGFKM